MASSGDVDRRYRAGQAGVPSTSAEGFLVPACSFAGWLADWLVGWLAHQGKSLFSRNDVKKNNKYRNNDTENNTTARCQVSVCRDGATRNSSGSGSYSENVPLVSTCQPLQSYEQISSKEQQWNLSRRANANVHGVAMSNERRMKRHREFPYPFPFGH